MAYIGQPPNAFAPLSSADIPDGIILAADLADDSVGTDEIVNDAVTADKLANSINTDIATGVAALPKAGGAMTGTITNFTSTGIDDNASGAVAITIDSDEKVGIGTAASTPLGNLHVASGDSSATANANADELVIEGNTVSGLSILSGTSSTGSIYFGDSVNNEIGTIIYDHSDNEMSFMTDGSTRMYITDTGNVGIGMTPGSSTRLAVKSSHSNDGGYNVCLMQEQDGSNLLYITTDGTFWTASSWSTSDRRKKENISYMTEDILPKIEKLKFAKFDMIGYEALKNCYGFIAQDVEAIFPDCIHDKVMPGTSYDYDDEIPEGKKIGDVKEEGEEQKNMNYNYLFSYLVKAVQELSAKVTALESA